MSEERQDFMTASVGSGSEPSPSETGDDWIGRLKDAILDRERKEAILRAEMAKSTAELRVTSYGELPGWGNYQRSVDKVVEIEKELCLSRCDGSTTAAP